MKRTKKQKLLLWFYFLFFPSKWRYAMIKENAEQLIEIYLNK